LGLGARGEELAALELGRRGYEVVESDARSRWGQIDLVAREGGEWVVVEVRTRSGTMAGSAAESLGWDKRRRLLRLAEGWLQSHGHSGEAWRVDLVALEVGYDGAVRRCEVIRNALG
jgi:putative endonuclease